EVRLLKVHLHARPIDFGAFEVAAHRKRCDALHDLVSQGTRNHGDGTVGTHHDFGLKLNRGVITHAFYHDTFWFPAQLFYHAVRTKCGSAGNCIADHDMVQLFSLKNDAESGINAAIRIGACKDVLAVNK